MKIEIVCSGIPNKCPSDCKAIGSEGCFLWNADIIVMPENETLITLEVHDEIKIGSWVYLKKSCNSFKWLVVGILETDIYVISDDNHTGIIYPIKKDISDVYAHYKPKEA